MNNTSIWQKTYPHIIAFLVFYVLTVSYFYPLFQGKNLGQHDVTQAKGMMHEVETFNKYHEGESTLWTNAMFGGMPTYQIKMNVNGNLITWSIHQATEVLFQDEGEMIITFLLYIGFYILMLAITSNPWVSIIGAIAFALSSYNIISLEAGHINKVKAMAIIAPILGGLILGFQRKYLLGAIVTGIFVALQIRQKHYQITYYTLMLVATLGLVYLILYIKDKNYLSLTKIAGFLIIGATLGLFTNMSTLWPNYEYAQATIRGSESPLENTEDQSLDKTGLSYDYATRWSYGILETLTLIIPNFHGGASTGELSEDSNLAQAGIPDRYLNRIPLYWGSQPFTSGPVYFGAAIWLLFFFSLFIVRSPIKWGLLAATILSIMLSWGSNFSILYDLFFYYVPYFNKFRTPTMILVIAQVTVPCMAMLGVWEMLKYQFSQKELLKGLKYSFLVCGGIVVVFGIIGSFFFDFIGQSDARLENSGWPIDALREDRQSLLQKDAFRSLLFIVLAAVALWGYIQNKIKMQWLLVALGTVILIDLWMVDKRYLNNDSFVEDKGYKQEFAPSKADMQIINSEFENNQKAQQLYQEYLQQEKRAGNTPLDQLEKVDLKATSLRFASNYRVLNLASNTFNEAMTAYYHKSVGGYHAAKLRRYQELIERHISKRNRKVLNMLNTRYLIVSGQNNNQAPQVRQNPDALGSVWFVSNYELKESASEVMSALNQFNPAQTALINKKNKDHVNGLNLSNKPKGSIELVNYKPNHLTYKSQTPNEQLAVFSEVYYNNEKGWKATIDGKPAEHFRVNYVLRAMRVPSGEHTIEFKFRPKSYYMGENIAYASSSLLLLGLLGVFVRALLIYYQFIKPSDDDANNDS